MIRVLLVDETRLMGNVIADVLDQVADVRVVGWVTRPEEALAQAHGCDVILVSTRLPDDGALRLTRSVVGRGFPARVLILDLANSPREILDYVEAGAAGYVLKDDAVEDLVRKVRAAHCGQALVSPQIAAALMARLTALAQAYARVEEGTALLDRIPAGELTAREQEILRLIGRGLSNQAIAQTLVVELGTVKNHVHNILHKLNVTSRRDAVAYLNRGHAYEQIGG